MPCHLQSVPEPACLLHILASSTVPRQGDQFVSLEVLLRERPHEVLPVWCDLQKSMLSMLLLRVSRAEWDGRIQTVHGQVFSLMSSLP